MYLLNKKKNIVKLILLTGLCATYIWGAGSTFCKKYAEEAVGQFYLAKYHHMPGIHPPVWQDDYEAHKKWCELPIIPRIAAENETRKRKIYIDNFFQRSRTGDQSHCLVHKNILPDGSVEIHYSDGVIKTITDRGISIKYPDGRIVRPNGGIQIYTNVQRATMPKEPATLQEKNWLLFHASKLLEVIKAQVQDEQVFQNYINFEDANLSIFEQIEKRSQTIKYLAVP